MKIQYKPACLAVILAAVCLLQGCSFSKITTVHATAKYGSAGEAVEAFEKQIGTYENWIPEGGFMEGSATYGLIDICNSYFKVGNMSKSEECAEAYEKLFLDKISEKTHGRWAASDRNYYGIKRNRLLVKLYLELENLDKARIHAEKAIDLNIREYGSLTKTRSTPIHAAFIANAAIVFARTGDRERGLELLASIPEIKAGKSIDIPVFKKAKNAHQARGYMALGEYEKAKTALNRGLGKAAWLGRGLLFLNTLGTSELIGSGKQMSDPLSLEELFMASKILLHTGEYEKAKRGYDAMIDNRHKSGLMNLASVRTDLSQRPGLFYLILHDRGRIALHEGDREAAANYFRRALDIIEAQRATIHTESSKIGFVGNKQAVYRDLTALLIEMGRHEEAFAIAERSKARALVDMLASKKDFGGGNRSDTEKLASLLHQSGELEELALRHEPAEGSGTESITRSIQLKQKEILRADAEFSSLVTVTPPDVKTLQAMLPEDETLIEYYGDETALFAFVVGRDRIRGMELGPVDIRKNVGRFRTWLQNPPAKVRGIKIAKTDRPDPEGKEAGKALYDKLIAPLSREIETRNITIVPHGALHYLPFNALFDGEDYLIDHYRLRILPSAGVMAFLKNETPPHEGRLLAFGNPDLNDPGLDLPGAEAESRAITRNDPDASLYTRKGATETIAKEDGERYRYIHFALHGTFDSEAPLSSGLLMAPDKQNDGILTVGELYNLNIPAELVTLSACETALGKIDSGDDVVGFTRGFLYAGTQSIVSSLWKVDDRATSELMKKFYLELEKTDKRRALREAQRYVKENIDAHPYYWAAFQLTGKI